MTEFETKLLETLGSIASSLTAIEHSVYLQQETMDALSHNTPGSLDEPYIIIRNTTGNNWP